MKINITAITEEKAYGMPASHITGVLAAAQNENVVIGIRPVSKFARYFIEAGCPTKPFIVKNKSANLGPMAGLIPIDSLFSRVEEKDVEKYTKMIHSAQHRDPLIRPMQLSLSEARIRELELFFGGALHVTRINSIAFVITWKKMEETINTFALAENPGLNFKFFYRDQKTPILVLGKLLVNEDNIRILKPITADYDLLVVCPCYDDFDPAGKDRTLFETQGVTRRSSLMNKMAIYRTMEEGYIGPKENSTAGNWSPRISNIVSKVNFFIGKTDPVREIPELRTFHHNAEFNNPFAAALHNSLPALLVFPRSMNLSNLKDISDIGHVNLTKVDMILIETLFEMKIIRDFLRDEGYYWPGHVKYRDELPAFRPGAKEAAEQSIELLKNRLIASKKMEESLNNLFIINWIKSLRKLVYSMSNDIRNTIQNQQNQIPEISCDALMAMISGGLLREELGLWQVKNEDNQMTTAHGLHDFIIIKRGAVHFGRATEKKEIFQFLLSGFAADILHAGEVRFEYGKMLSWDKKTTPLAKPLPILKQKPPASSPQSFFSAKPKILATMDKDKENSLSIASKKY